MDVLRLDSNTYLPDTVIEGYDSMIWTERFTEAGEFQLNTPDVSRIRELIPEGSLITHRETKEVMLVETHAIDRKEDRSSNLKVTGRTFETFLGERDLNTTADTGSGLIFASPATEIEYYLWYDIVGNQNGVPTSDWIPNVVVTDSVTGDGPSGPRVVTNWGNKYEKVLKLLQDGNFGIRNIRPTSTGKVVTFDASLDPTKLITTDIPKLRFDVYTGTDRTREQSINTPVVMSYESGDMTDPKYLFNIKGFKNVVIAKTNDGPRTYYGSGASAATSGLDRRVLTIDATDWTAAEGPFEEAVQKRALDELAKYNQRMLFDSEVSPLAHYKYNTHYFLGDKITVAAEYGFAKTMRVSEFVRAEDQSGDRGYPTLVLAND